MPKKAQIPRSPNYFLNPNDNIVFPDPLTDDEIQKIRAATGRDSKTRKPILREDYQLTRRLNNERFLFCMWQNEDENELSLSKQKEYLKQLEKRANDFAEAIEVMGFHLFNLLSDEGAFQWKPSIEDYKKDNSLLETVLAGQSLVDFDSPKKLLGSVNALREAAQHTIQKLKDSREPRRGDFHHLVAILADVYEEASAGKTIGRGFTADQIPNSSFLRFVKACLQYFPVQNSNAITNNSIDGAIRAITQSGPQK